MAHSSTLTTFLIAARAETQACHNLNALQRAIARTEHYLAREIADWFTLGQEPRYG